MNDDYMSEADNEVDGGYFADLEYAYQQKEIRRQEDKENKAKKEENRKQQLLMQTDGKFEEISRERKVDKNGKVFEVIEINERNLFKPSEGKYIIIK